MIRELGEVCRCAEISTLSGLWYLAVIPMAAGFGLAALVGYRERKKNSDE